MSVQLMVYNCSRTKCRWKDLPLGVVKLLAILYALRPPPLCEAAAVPVRYVKPIDLPDATCPSEPCYTLDEYVNNSTRYFVSNTVFMFLSGSHKLSNSLNVSGMSNITLTPQTMSGNAVQINADCAHIVFENCTNITLSNLETSEVVFSFLGLSGIVSLSHIHMTLTCESEVCFVNTTQECMHNGVEICFNNISMMSSFWNEVNGICVTLCASNKITFEISNANICMCDVGLEILINYNKKQAIVAGSTFSVKNTTLQSNNLGLLVSPAFRSAVRLSTTLNITLDNVSFIGNEMGANIYKAQEITFHDCTFTHNSDSALIAINSILRLTGYVNFLNNTGYRGGAVSLTGLSIIRLPEPQNTQVYFENNTATDRGGALYFSNEMIQTREFDLNNNLLCPFVLELDLQAHLFFINNKATTGIGNAIYGGYIENDCLLPQSSSQPINIILNISRFQPTLKEDFSAIVSDNYIICACKNQQPLQFKDCALNLVTIYPGQLFTVSVAVITISNPHKMGIIPVTSTSLRAQPSKDAKLHDNFQVHDGTCTNLTYSIRSSKHNAQLYLTYEDNHNNNRSIKINFIRPCPLGFNFSQNLNICSCNELVKNIVNVHCNISQNSISWTDQSWIGVINTSNSSLLAVSSFCQYCRNGSQIKVDLDTPQMFDLQCMNSHSGVLCGGCKKNYSLALGSNNCLPQKKCTNQYLSLMIAFLAAGIALVFFIKILNLTISHGTLNGLIFYANIVGANPTIFPITDIKPFFSVFIAWLNLDLGIETCFFDGMDAYIKAWLQFVFPVYVWAIALFIIVLSHYSMRASKLFGNNSVPVLATLILLSYSKLLRAVISAFSVAEIRVENENKSVLVWERNGNIQYLTGKHIPLFVFALVVLLLLWFPFTLVLVSIQWLQRGTHYRVLCWVTKLMPFFDAFTGPLKEKHRYWVGTLLLVRCILLIFFFVSTRNTSLITTTTAMFAALVYLASVGSVYQKRHVAILELFYIVNLGMLSVLMLLASSIHENTSLEVSVGIAFGQFIVTVIYLIYLRLAHMIKRLFVRPMHHSSQQGMDNAVCVERNSSSSHFSHTSVEMERSTDGEVRHLLNAPGQKNSSYRESLLAYVN